MKDPRKRGLKTARCPKCLTTVDSATEILNPDEPVKPRAGDFAVCSNCAAFLVYVADDQVRMVGPRDMETWSAVEVELMVRARRLILIRRIS